MTDKAIQYLESHRKIIIEIDTSELVDVAIKVWDFLKATVQEVYNETLITPEVIFDGDESESLDFNWVILKFQKENKQLELVIFKDKSGVSFYYKDQLLKKSETHWYSLDKPLTNWFADTLLLFTE